MSDTTIYYKALTKDPCKVPPHFSYKESKNRRAKYAIDYFEKVPFLVDLRKRQLKSTHVHKAIYFGDDVVSIIPLPVPIRPEAYKVNLDPQTAAQVPGLDHEKMNGVKKMISLIFNSVLSSTVSA